MRERLDPLTPAQRSERMSRLHNRDTKPEMIVRRLVHAMGYRYRLHDRSLPGHPDLVFSRRRKVLFVHGCMWHQHGCTIYRQPKSGTEFWEPKLSRNVERDRDNQASLRSSGWGVLVVWECEVKRKDVTDLARRIGEFLGPTRDPV